MHTHRKWNEEKKHHRQFEFQCLYHQRLRAVDSLIDDGSRSLDIFLVVSEFRVFKGICDVSVVNEPLCAR